MRASVAIAAACLLLVAPGKARAQVPLEILHTFDPQTEGYPGAGYPGGGVIQASDGNFYGASGGGASINSLFATIFRISSQGAHTILHTFSGEVGITSLIQASDGNLYGAAHGGAFLGGVIFRMALDGTFTVLHEFSGLDGSSPSSALIQASDGELYGTTQWGGAFDLGTAFRMSLAGTFTTIHAFAGGAADVASPLVPLVEASGAFYGVGSSTSSCVGQIFRMNAQGDVTVLQSFSTFDGDYSCYPARIGLARSSDGNLYGTTENSGKGLVGLFYRLSPSGAFTVLNEFPSGGVAPTSTLMEAQDGNFYAQGGGIFRLTREGNTAVINGLSGTLPPPGGGARLVQGSDGELYGTGTGFTSTNPSFFRLWLHFTPRDVDGGGRADILWRGSTGAVAAWVMNGASVVGGGSVGTADPAWQIAGQADFNGDRKADILWRHSSGAVAIWLMDGNRVIGSAGVGMTDPAWQIAGTGYFNADTRADILWRHATTGGVALWFIDGTNVIGSRGVGTADLTWEIAGTGDFNGDGRADILWRHMSGMLSRWTPREFGIDTGSVRSADPAWRLAATGDFDGDGQTDILWQHMSGETVIWLLRGGRASYRSSPPDIAGGYVSTVDASWQIAGSGDYNGDGHADILWRHASGAMATWLMSGTRVVGSSPVTALVQGVPVALAPGPDWQVVNVP